MPAIMNTGKNCGRRGLDHVFFLLSLQRSSVLSSAFNNVREMANSVYKINKGINKPVRISRFESPIYLVSGRWAGDSPYPFCLALYHWFKHLFLCGINGCVRHRSFYLGVWYQ
jgi:hypothetical protein